MSLERRLGRDKKFKNQKLEKTRRRRKKLDGGRRQTELGDLGRRNDLLPELRVRQVPILELLPSPHRTRRLSEDHVERLMAAIAGLGFTVPILVDDEVIIDGHIRVEAARRLGLETAPAINVSHLSATERRKLALAANRLGELGEWDLDQLRIEFAELIELDVDLTSTGFSDEEIDIILLDPDDAEAGGAEEEIDDPPEYPVTQLGDLWLLDAHRLLCGDALETEAYATVLEGETAHALLTDLPYNVRIKGNVSGLGKKTHEEFAMASGEMNEKEWQAFLDKVLALLASNVVAGAVLFTFMDWRSIHRLYQAGFAAKLKLLNLAVWFKEAGGMGTLYRSAHELICVFCKGEKPRINNVELGKHGRDRTNVWCAPGANRRGSSANEMLALHPTAKPVELCVDAILDVTERGDTVLDAFLGSGTTLIAAEKIHRRCCGIEIDPRYVDVALRRWERITGRQAVLAETGETLEEVADRRLGDDNDHPSEESQD